jgi:hypothetical protein
LYSVEGFFKLHSRATEGKKGKKRVQKDNFLANYKKFKRVQCKTNYYGNTKTLKKFPRPKTQDPESRTQDLTIQNPTKTKRVNYEYEFKFRNMNKNLILDCLMAQARCLR